MLDVFSYMEISNSKFFLYLFIILSLLNDQNTFFIDMYNEISKTKLSTIRKMLKFFNIMYILSWKVDATHVIYCSFAISISKLKTTKIRSTYIFSNIQYKI